MLLFCYCFAAVTVFLCRVNGNGKIMLSVKLIQNTIDEVVKVTGRAVILYDANGIPLYFTGEIKRQPDPQIVVSFAEGRIHEDDPSVYGMARVVCDDNVEYVVALGEADPASKTIANLVALQIKSLENAYKENPDKENFLKNLLLDNIILADVYTGARKYNIKESVKRAVIIVENPKYSAHSLKKRLEKSTAVSEQDLITAVDDHYFIIIKQLEDPEGYEEISNAAREAMLSLGENVRAAYGTIVKELKDVSRSYKEAQLAIDIGRIFQPEKDIVAYSTLGIGRLIYQLPLPLCRLFIKEVFSNRTPDCFDEETITTVSRFFENNLNVSETSRQLYIHRNTLVYRLDKIYKMTGLDLRLFEDAIIFKIALMVVRYMKYMETTEQ